MSIEANIPAPQPQSAADSRISEADENRDGPQGAEPAKGKGPPPSHRLGSPAREGRLRTHKDFQNLYEHGSAARGEFGVLILRANGGEGARFGVVASKKVGSAVVRNRCKRLLREAARGLTKSYDLSGCDILLIARPPCRKARFDAVRAEFQELYVSLRGRMAHSSPVNGSTGS